MGKAYAYAFAKEGARVVLADLNGKNVKQVADDIGERAVAISMDVSSLSDWERAVEIAHQHFGDIQILINNAGIADQTPFEYLTEEAFRRSMEVNLMSVFLQLQDGGRGHEKSKLGTHCQCLLYRRGTRCRGQRRLCFVQAWSNGSDQDRRVRFCKAQYLGKQHPPRRY